MSYRLLWVRVAVVTLLFAATACVLFARPAERVPPTEPLDRFPTFMGGRMSTDIVISPEVREVLGRGDFLQRTYQSAHSLPIELFVAYFSSQSAGDTIHSPKNCLPGSGWTPVQASYTWLGLTANKKVRVNRYVIAKGSNREVVLYWYQAHGRVIASEYWAKFYLVADAIRTNRTDGGLVRLVTPILRGESDEQAVARLGEFAKDLAPALPRFIPN